MNRLLSECKGLLERGATHEELIALLKERGLSRVESIRVLAVVARLPIREAKERVHFSRAWRAEMTAAEEFHGLMERTIDEPEEPGAQ